MFSPALADFQVAVLRSTISDQILWSCIEEICRVKLNDGVLQLRPWLATGWKLCGWHGKIKLSQPARTRRRNSSSKRNTFVLILCFGTRCSEKSLLIWLRRGWYDTMTEFFDATYTVSGCVSVVASSGADDCSQSPIHGPKDDSQYWWLSWHVLLSGTKHLYCLENGMRLLAFLNATIGFYVRALCRLKSSDGISKARRRDVSLVKEWNSHFKRFNSQMAPVTSWWPPLTTTAMIHWMWQRLTTLY